MHAQIAQALALHAEFKAKAPDTILMFRVGDFYEMFHDDARTAHKVFGVALTTHEGVVTAGVPYHNVENYLRHLIMAGHRVAICEHSAAADAAA